MGIKTILINTTHCNNSTGNKNSFTYKFVGGGLELNPNQKHSIAVSNITIPYSFFNISDIYNNRNVQLIINGTTYNINLPASFMDADSINKFFQWWFIQNNFYVLDAFGNYVYFFEIELNQSRYAIECIFYPMTLPTGGSNPAGMTLSGNTMQLVISSTNANFGKLLGLSPGTYPSTVQTVTTSQLSNITVEASPINAISLACPGFVNNSISSTVDTFFAFTPNNASFGSNITLQPPELLWVDINPGRHQQLTINIRDQENREIQCRDSTVCIMIALKSED